jgi:hypothetical protein
MTYDPPPGFALNIVQGKGYIGDLTQLVLDRAISRNGPRVKRQRE